MMATHRGRRAPHVEIVVEREEHGVVFFRHAGLGSLPRDLFDQSYAPIEREALREEAPVGGLVRRKANRAQRYEIVSQSDGHLTLRPASTITLPRATFEADFVRQEAEGE